MLDEDERFFKLNGTPLFSSHMIDLSEEPVQWNIDTTAKYLQRAAPMKQWLEMEIGITGGEEDVRCLCFSSVPMSANQTRASTTRVSCPILHRAISTECLPNAGNFPAGKQKPDANSENHKC